MTRIHLVIVLFVVITFAPQQFTVAQSGATIAGATIEGIVLDAASGQPLEDVRVSLSATVATDVGYTPLDLRTLPLPVVSDSQGRFSIKTTQAGHFRVVPTRDGYVFSHSRQTHTSAGLGVWVQVVQGQRIENLELHMARPAVISGRVLDSEGKPFLATAGSVSLMQYTYGMDGNRALVWIPGISYPGSGGSAQRVNDRGEFRFFGLPSGEYYVSVAMGGPIGSSGTYYYPGVSDGERAVPIHVNSGEEIQLGTISLPSREKGVAVRLHISGVRAGLNDLRYVYIANSLMVTSPKNSGVLSLTSVASGQYEILISNRSDASKMYYGRATIDVGSSSVDQDVVVQPGAKVKGRILQQNEDGSRSDAPASVQCRLRSKFDISNCADAGVVPGPQEFELGLPMDTYVLSAKSGDKNLLTEEFNVTGDTEMEIVLATPGSILEGTVRNADSDKLPDAVVVLVPDPPYRQTSLRYRSVITDRNGRFEIHGIAPGSYKLFAWSELEGFAYRNSEFMKEFENRGTPVEINKGSRLSADLTAL